MIGASLLLLATTLVAQNPKTELTEFKSEAGKFSVSLPGKPTESSTDVPTPIGKIAMRTFMIEEGQNAQAVLYSDYPDSILKADPQKVLDGAQAGAVNNIKGKIVKEEKVKMGEVPGRAFEYEAKIQNLEIVGRSRIYLDKARLYQVMIVGSPQFVRSERSTKLLDSFKITK